MSKELKLDKSTWVKTKLGELAEEISVRVENPSKSQYDRFVGLDCFVSGELKIKKWSETSNVNSSAKAFKAGDVLFARRNAYLKRASLVEFDGCCSGDAFVLRENHDKIVPGFLSFIVNSEKLWTYANSNAEGTMSKRVKWRDLANYEFLLPPKAQQAELAELLWAMDTVIEKDLQVLERLEGYIKLFIEDFFTDTNSSLDKIKLGEISYINKYSLNNKTPQDYEFSYIDLSSIEPRKLKEVDRIKFSNSPSRARRIVKDNSIIISTVRPYQLCNVYIEVNNQDYIASTGTAVINIKSDINPKFLFEQFFTKKYVKFIEDRMTGTNYPAITAKDLEDFEVYISDDKALVQNFINKTEQLNKSKYQLESKLQSSKALQKALINQVF